MMNNPQAWASMLGPYLQMAAAQQNGQGAQGAQGAGAMPQAGQQMAPQGAMGGAPMGQGGAVSPELVQAILGMQQQGTQSRSLDRSRALAERLRADAGGQLKGRQVGNVYVAPNALNAAASLYGNYKAGRMDDESDTKENNMSAQQMDAMRRYFEAMTGRSSQPRLPHMGDMGE